MKLLLLIFLGTFQCLILKAQTDTIKSRTAYIESQRLKLKNYAFCECLSHVYENDSLFVNDGSIAGYFETSSYWLEAYQYIDTLARKFAAKKYSSKKKGKSLGLMKCLDFYNSKELETAIKRLDIKLD